ncbi:acylneuraminate cytidylyltransferase family protein [Flavobacterium sedimenticola]|uniref:Acylneuraminate cytidylyltransferase family protein n=1 Tax=Flavobacterium sedimenticola TaxID=3043286 RepID=A0ABT6XRI2_9FLAO|nr:acylneuraminate cytidylyltransferase family protein [Flavobacterium sedimenticola]MDI9257671.1 acylneuraminate cytidylyltransferase family protein [Flavobacterium sedimenticola]
MKTLVIIPARGGSKGVPNKNIKILGDKPLIAHAIACAQASQKATRIIVSTDAEAIAVVAQQYGCEVVLRPESLATDTSNVVTAVAHVYAELQEDFDFIVLLQPTSPLRTGADLDAIITLLEEEDHVDGVISVVPMDDMHPARMYTLGNAAELIPFMTTGETARRQDLAPVYYRNGCFYAVRTNAFLTEKSFMVARKKAYVMSAEWLANIDTPRDFKIAELLYADWKHENTPH